MSSWIPNQNNNNMMMGQANFNPYNQSFIGTPQNLYSQGRAPVYKADPIHGENAAWAFPIGGGEIYLPDANEDIIWWIRIDQNGNKQVIPFDVSPHEKKPQVNIDDIAARLAAVEEWINGKQNKSNAKRTTTAAITAATTE